MTFDIFQVDWITVDIIIIVLLVLLLIGVKVLKKYIDGDFSFQACQRLGKLIAFWILTIKFPLFL